MSLFITHLYPTHFFLKPVLELLVMLLTLVLGERKELLDRGGGSKGDRVGRMVQAF